jgi:hypothetical protein
MKTLNCEYVKVNDKNQEELINLTTRDFRIDIKFEIPNGLRTLYLSSMCPQTDLTTEIVRVRKVPMEPSTLFGPVLHRIGHEPEENCFKKWTYVRGIKTIQDLVVQV